jgi:hypothetical protein
MSKTSKTNLQSLFQSAVQSGTLSSASSSLLGGHLGQVVIAGAAGLDAENIVAADVTLITLLVDCSSSISAYGLQKSVRDGQKLLLQSLQQSSQKESILLALWTFNHDQRVQHSYVPLDDAITLTSKNYRPRAPRRSTTPGVMRSQPTSPTLKCCARAARPAAASWW